MVCVCTVHCVHSLRHPNGNVHTFTEALAMVCGYIQCIPCNCIINSTSLCNLAESKWQLLLLSLVSTCTWVVCTENYCKHCIFTCDWHTDMQDWGHEYMQQTNTTAVHLPNITETKGDELTVDLISLHSKVATGASPLGPSRTIWWGFEVQAIINPPPGCGKKNPMTSPADTVMLV